MNYSDFLFPPTKHTLTGSGKSYTMMGSLVDEELKGIIPRLCDILFDRIVEVAGSDDKSMMMVWSACFSLCTETAREVTAVVQGGGLIHGDLL